MEFNKEIFEKALKANKIVRYQQHFEAVVKSYLEIESQAFCQPHVSGSLQDRLFELANDFAKDKQGDVAVKLHSIHNGLL